MLPQGKIGIGLQMPGQPLSQGLALHRGPAGDLVYVDVPRKAPSLVPALDGRTRDPKELCNLLSWDAAVYCGEHFQSEVPRIGVHGGILMRVRYLRKPLSEDGSGRSAAPGGASVTGVWSYQSDGMRKLLSSRLISASTPSRMSEGGPA